MLKDFQVDLELSPKDNRVIQTGATYWSHDVNTAKINIKLLRYSEPVVLNKDVTVRVMMLFDDENKSEHIYTAKIEDEKAGIVSVILDKNVRSYVGQVICGVYADYGAEQKTDNGYFTFAMKRSLIDKRMPEMKQYYVSDFEDTLAKMKLANAEFAEVETKLNNRIDVIEKDIVSNEVVKRPQIAQLESDVANLDFLSENLFIGTAKFETDKWINAKDWQKEGAFNGFVVMKRIGQWSGLSQEINVQKGEVYTLSAYVKSDEVADVGFYANYSGSIVSGHEKKIVTKTDWTRVSVTFTVINGGKIRPRFENNKAGSALFICAIKLDKNKTVKNWSPNLLDLAYQNDVSNLQKQIDDIKKAITNLGGTL